MKASRRTPRTASTAPAVAEAAADTTEPAQVLRRFRLIFNAVKTHFQQVEKKAGVGGAQLWALSVVAAQPGIGVNGLAQAMDVHQTTASNLVKGLTEMALLEARREGPDRRAVQLHLLPAARKVLQRAPGPFAGVLPDALAQLDSTTLARLDQDLGRLIELLQADERGAGVPLGQR